MTTSRCTARWSALAAGARSRGIPVLVLVDQVTLDEPTLCDAGVTAAFSIADYAGSVQLAIDDAANELAGLTQVTAAEVGNSGGTRYR